MASPSAISKARPFPPRCRSTPSSPWNWSPACRRRSMATKPAWWWTRPRRAAWDGSRSARSMPLTAVSARSPKMLPSASAAPNSVTSSSSIRPLRPLSRHPRVLPRARHRQRRNLLRPARFPAHATGCHPPRPVCRAQLVPDSQQLLTGWPGPAPAGAELQHRARLPAHLRRARR